MFQNHRHDEEELAQAALNALHATTGLTGQLVQVPRNASQGTYRPDVAIELNVDDASLLFYGECKTNVDRRSILAQVKSQLDALDAPGLLVAPYLSRTMLESCRVVGLQSIDTAGNAYLDAPGLYVLVKGQKASSTQIVNTPERLSANTSALRMIFALLAYPALITASYREIAKAAGIALGAVGSIYQDLARRGLATGFDKVHGRRILDRDRLVDEWVAMYPVRLRPKLHVRRFKAPDPYWWQNVDPIELDAWWGGEIAADRLTGMLKPSTQTLYVLPDQAQRCLRSLIARYRLSPNPEGEFELLDAFWNLPRNQRHPQLVPPILVYADLLASLDPRNMTVAKAIRDTMIADVQHSI